MFWRLRRIGVVADAFPESDDDPPERRGKVYPLLRAYTVFNVAQIDGLPPQYGQLSMPTWDPEAKAEELLLMSGARFRMGGARAFYQPASDENNTRQRSPPSPPRRVITASRCMSSLTGPGIRTAAIVTSTVASVMRATQRKSSSPRWARRTSAPTAVLTESCDTRVICRAG